MRFDEIHPFVRYARIFDESAVPDDTTLIPRDARLFYCYEGEVAIEIGDFACELTKGSLLIIKPGLAYKYQMNLNTHFKIIGINFDFTYEYSHLTRPIDIMSIHSYNPDEIVGNVCFDDAPELNSYLYIPSIIPIESKLLKIEKEYRTRTLYYNAKISGILTDVITKALRTVTFANTKDDNDTSLIMNVIDYIHKHFNEKITNEHIASRFNFHPNYLNTLIKKTTGMSLHQYVLGIRISNAVSLLETTSKSVGEISTLTGFDEIANFSKHFKKVTGVNPSNYRKINNISKSELF
ncbi:MAG: helix-turn-helix transcriptional regulator [Ruminococcaceae bacterium]|nr:helix-turn-helix transcriptional regulator [Oscillospiraceae bacterium]